jgi:hypothetical protein
MYHFLRHKPRLELVIASAILFFVQIHPPVYGKCEKGSWNFLQNDEDEIWFYYNEIECPAPDLKIVRTKIIYNKTGVLRHVKKYGKEYKDLEQAISVWEIDCSQRKFRLLNVVFYAKDRSIIECYNDEREKHFTLEDIPAGSFLESVSEKICR